MPERGPVPSLQYLFEMVPRWLPWMTVNLALGAIPVVLALVLFRAGRRTGVLWWAGFAVFVVFLPNAPYVLTNYRWLVGPWRNAWHHDRWRFVTILPFWATYFALGFGAFVVSVRLAQRFIEARWGRPVGRAAVVALTAASSVGLYLGRADLFSWSVVTEPQLVADTVGAVGRGAGVSGMALAFVALLAGYAAAVAGFEAWRRARRADPDPRPDPEPGAVPAPDPDLDRDARR